MPKDIFYITKNELFSEKIYLRNSEFRKSYFSSTRKIYLCQRKDLFFFRRDISSPKFQLLNTSYWISFHQEFPAITYYSKWTFDFENRSAIEEIVRCAQHWRYNFSRKRYIFCAIKIYLRKLCTGIVSLWDIYLRRDISLKYISFSWKLSWKIYLSWDISRNC